MNIQNLILKYRSGTPLSKEEIEFLFKKILPIFARTDVRTTFPIDAQRRIVEAILNQEVSPKDKNDGNALWVHQQTFFNLGIFEKNTSITYTINIPENGVYLFLIEGEIEVDNQILKPRDAMGIIDIDQFEIKINLKAKILLVEVPMK